MVGWHPRAGPMCRPDRGPTVVLSSFLAAQMRCTSRGGSDIGRRRVRQNPPPERGSMRNATRVLPAALAALLLVLAIDGARSRPAAEAFSLPVHRSILDRALTGAMSPDALDTVYGYFAGLVGSGNAGQDVFSGQYPAEYHVDSARNPEEICKLWSEGFQTFMDKAVRLSAPEGVEKRELEDRNGALAAFGQ